MLYPSNLILKCTDLSAALTEINAVDILLLMFLLLVLRVKGFFLYETKPFLDLIGIFLHFVLHQPFGYQNTHEHVLVLK
jgi:hypothetical protein